VPFRLSLRAGTVALAAAVALTGIASLVFSQPESQAPLMWLPSGFAAALLALHGYRWWPAVFVGDALALLPAGLLPASAALTAAAYCVEAIAAAWLMQRYMKAPATLESSSDALKLIAISVFLPAIAALAHGLVSATSEDAVWADFVPAWLSWWAAGACGMVIMAPLVLGWRRARALTWPSAQRWELIALASLLCAAALLAFASASAGSLPFAFSTAALPFVAWAAYRFDRRTLALLIAIVAAIAAWFCPSASDGVPDDLLRAAFTVFVLATAMTGYLGAGLRGRQRRTVDMLKLRHREVCGRISERALKLEQANHALREEIAARSRTEKLLQESEERFRMMVEGILDYGIVALDSLGNVSSWNAGALRITGYRADEIIGQHLSRFYTRADNEDGRPARDLQTAAEAGRFEHEGLRVRRDGGTYWASDVLTPIRDHGGTLLGFSQVTRDLTERRRTQKLLQESEERFRTMVESLVDYAFYMLDPQGNIASWNAGAARVYGYLADEVAGKHVSRLYPRAEAEQRKPGREMEMAAVAGRVENEGWQVRKDGATFWASVIITAVRDSSGKLVGFSKMTRDLTERRRVELELRGAKAAAERASQAKSEFLATMSHELRTPLNSLLILSRLLSDNVGGNLAPKQLEYARTIHASGMDLLSLINDILDLARIESGAQTPLNFTVETFERIAVDVERTFRQVAESRGIAFDIRLDGDLPQSVRTDAQRLQQIIKNLLSNAFKFTRQGSVTLHIRCARDGWTPGHARLDAARRVVAIAVTDTGIGIPADKIDLIFEPFQQADGSTSREFGGTGLGLSISRALARLLGGELKLSSRVGEGSTFTLYLPASGDAPSTETKPATADMAPASRA
jgi:PAS domain S-box-containing protein